jgi:Zn-dependent peptidase ImmA (M78 family)
MTRNLPHGFKAAAERLALSVRAELGLDPLAPINCAEICAQFGIPILTVPELELSGASPRSIQRILSPDAKFSAMTVAAGTRRLIVYNPMHPAGRQANSLAHELSHILLEHLMAPALGEGGCRRWDSRLEAEADWQAGTLLVPRDAALTWMRSNGSLEDGAAHFGVSVPLLRWRLNQTGIVRQLAASSFLSKRKRSA